MLREFLYLFIFVGVTHIFVNLNLLHYHEAFLASGVVALLALILIEPAGKRKTSRALILSSLVITLYLLGLKLPLILQEKLNNYLAYFLVGVLIGSVNLVILLLVRRHAASSSG